MISRPTLSLLALILTAIWLAVAQASGAAEIDQQRKLFLDVHDTVELGDWSPVEGLSPQERALLGQYVLWPDLRAAYFRATMKTAKTTDIDRFLDEYGMLKPARELRYRYALQLVRNDDLASYLSIYQQFYQGLEIEKLDCLALQAELEAGRDRRVVTRALELWNIGESQVEECDPVFAYLQSNNFIGPAEYNRRYALAIGAREFGLARWLAKSIDAQHVDAAASWSSAQSNPESFISSHAKPSGNSTPHQQLAYAIERITYADPELARELWTELTRRYQFSAELRYRTDRHIALWTARDNLPGAYALLVGLPLAAQNTEVLRWRARSNIRSELWPQLLQDIAAMRASEQNADEWRYWRAIALGNSGDAAAAAIPLEILASQRSYYGFLAADELDRAYVFGHNETVADEATIAVLTQRPDLIRARELFLVGLESRGRSEWDAVVSYFNTDEKRQAAILADRWGWHSRAISTAASIGEFDDLALRYPLPYRAMFQQFAAAASIPPTWAYGITRSESLFMRDVRSSAGAIGLMQLMPATGKGVARAIQLPYSGLDTLTTPSSNIQLGTMYLAQMSIRFGGNRVLATAAYNAGPHRVDQWLPEHGTVDARAWIETIPFNETRKYVRRVLVAETIFHWRMTGDTRRLSDELKLVQAAQDSQRLVSR
jgi:soluble lytic murein transglycosylase